jgi:hypothetical protein
MAGLARGTPRKTKNWDRLRLTPGSQSAPVELRACFEIAQGEGTSPPVAQL